MNIIGTIPSNMGDISGLLWWYMHLCPSSLFVIQIYLVLGGRMEISLLDPFLIPCQRW